MSSAGQGKWLTRNRAIAIAISLLLIIIAMGVAWYGFLLNQVEEQLFEVPWGIDVVSYVYFALMATGSSIVNSVYTIFGYKGPKGEYERIIKYGVWFSLATIFPAWLMVLLSLAKPFDFAYILLYFRMSSRIAWMALLYSLFALMLVVELIYMILADRFTGLKKMKYAEMFIGIAVLVATVAVHSNLGEVFGALISMPAWYGPWFSLYFILSAVLLGGAGQAIFLYAQKGKDAGLRAFFSRYYSSIFLIMIPIYAMATIWMTVVAWYSRETVWPVYQSLMFGSGALEFWVVEIFLGILLPLALSIYGVLRRNAPATILSSIALLIGGYAAKYSLIIGPQEMRPYVFLTLQLSNFTYAPTLGLIMMLTGAAILWPSVYVLGTQILPLEEGQRPRWLIFG